jgi:uncharacterized membrane protein
LAGCLVHVKDSTPKGPNPDDLFEDCPENVKQLFRDAKRAKREKERAAWKKRRDAQEQDDRAQYER